MASTYKKPDKRKKIRVYISFFFLIKINSDKFDILSTGELIATEVRVTQKKNKKQLQLSSAFLKYF